MLKTTIRTTLGRKPNNLPLQVKSVSHSIRFSDSDLEKNRRGESTVPFLPLNPTRPWYTGDLTEQDLEASVIAGTVVDSKSHSIKGAKVDLIKPLVSGSLSTTKTDHRGVYSFVVKDEGEYQVKVTFGESAHVQSVHAVKGEFYQLDFVI